MGPGHLGVAFAAKPAAPRVPLAVLLVATEALDILCFGFQAVGLEDFGASTTDINRGVIVLSPTSLPWSHGLLMSVVWSLAAAAAALLVYRERRAGAAVGLAVMSHWVFDFIVHPRDLPLLFGGSPTVGLGLWTTGPGLIISGVLEVALLAGGIAVYLAARRRRAVRGREATSSPN